jgi:ankyrin repeat protein
MTFRPLLNALVCVAVWTALVVPSRAGAANATPCQAASASPAAASPTWRGSPLHVAIRNNDAAGVSQLLDRAADPNEKDTLGNPPLIAALSPSVLFEPLVSGDARGRAGEVQREQAARIRIVSQLLRAGASPGLAGPRGMTPLIALAQWGFTSSDDVRLVGEMAARGAPLDAQNEDGDTAMIVAARRGKADVVKALVDRGAATGVTNCRGESAAAAAAAGAHSAIVRILTRSR